MVSLEGMALHTKYRNWKIRVTVSGATVEEKVTH